MLTMMTASPRLIAYEPQIITLSLTVPPKNPWQKLLHEVHFIILIPSVQRIHRVALLRLLFEGFQEQDSFR